MIRARYRPQRGSSDGDQLDGNNAATILARNVALEVRIELAVVDADLEQAERGSIAV